MKGVNFVNLRDAGDPAALAARYNKEGADELVVLDIAASRDHRPTFLETIRRVAAELAIPLTAGGGVATVDEGRAILRAGADKLTVNTAALRRPELLTELAAEFGSQAVVLAIDAKRVGDHWEAFVRGGRDPTGRDAVAWAQEGAACGAGEILLTSMDRDGTRSGFDLALTSAVSTVRRRAGDRLGRRGHARGFSGCVRRRPCRCGAGRFHLSRRDSGPRRAEALSGFARRAGAAEPDDHSLHRSAGWPRRATGARPQAATGGRRCLRPAGAFPRVSVAARDRSRRGDGEGKQRPLGAAALCQRAPMRVRVGGGIRTVARAARSPRCRSRKDHCWQRGVSRRQGESRISLAAGRTRRAQAIIVAVDTDGGQFWCAAGRKSCGCVPKRSLRN